MKQSPKRKTGKTWKEQGFGVPACKHLSMADCVKHPNCSWVKGYTKTMKKTGQTVEMEPQCQMKKLGKSPKSQRITKPSPKRVVAGREAAKTSPWIAFVKEFREQNPGLSYREAMQEARPYYEQSKIQVGGRRRNMIGGSYTPLDEEKYLNLLRTEEFPSYLPESEAAEITSDDVYRQFKQMYKKFPANFAFSDGRTPLAYWASWAPEYFALRPRIVKDLLQHGVDPNAIVQRGVLSVSMLHNMLDHLVDYYNYGYITTSEGLFDKDVEVDILIDMFKNALKYGADPNVKSDGQTVLQRVKNLHTDPTDRLAQKIIDGLQIASFMAIIE